MILSRLYMIAGIAVILSVLAFGWWSTSLKLDAVRLQRDKATADALASKLAGETQKRIHAEIDSARLTYIQSLENANNEIDALRNDLDAERKRLRVTGSCPKLPAVHNATRVEAPTCELDAEARRAYIDLRRGIKAWEAWAGLSVETLNTWEQETKKKPSD